MTTQELTIITQQLQIEKDLLNKYTSYVQDCADSELKKSCEKLASQHINHYNSLLNLLS